MSKVLQNAPKGSILQYSKTCLKRPLKEKTKIWFQDQLSFNAGQKYCRMLQGEHSAILSTFSKLPFAFKTFVFSILSGCLRQGLLYFQVSLSYHLSLRLLCLFLSGRLRKVLLYISLFIIRLGINIEVYYNGNLFNSYFASIFCPENVVCFLHLFHIFKST